MIIPLTFDLIKQAGFSTKEAFFIRKATVKMTPSQTLAELEMFLNDTDDERYLKLMNLLIVKIRA